MMSLCRGCQAVLPANANFCPNCGRALSESASPNAGTSASRPVRTGIGSGRKWLIGICLSVVLLMAIFSVGAIGNGKILFDTIVMAKSDAEFVMYGSMVSVVLLVIALVAALRNPRIAQNA